MAKKGAKENSGERKKSVKAPSGQGGTGVEKALIENFVALQHVMTDLSLKLNNLANQVSKLLELFEESAKTFMEKDVKLGGTDKEVAEKLDKLLDQNKIIARGLALLHETNAQTEQNYSPQPSQFAQPQITQPIQPNQAPGVDKYQRSISSR